MIFMFPPFMVTTMLEGICQSPFFGHYGNAKMPAFPAIWHCRRFGHEVTQLWPHSIL